MSTESWVSLEEIVDEAIFWHGTKIRVYTGWSSPDYYDYILSEIYDNTEYFQLTCISPYKAGCIFVVVALDLPNHYVLGKELKRMLTGENLNLVAAATEEL